MRIFEALAPGFDVGRRVCIKVPATWEGLQACRELEARGIATLATTMFCMEQAALAADAGCTYIAPYINELRVHFDKGYVVAANGAGRRAGRRRGHGEALIRDTLSLSTRARYVDEHKAFDFCREAQAYFKAGSRRTRVLAASLTSVDEVMQLAGVDHVTVSPPLLAALAAADASAWSGGTLGAYFSQTPPPPPAAAAGAWETRDYASLADDEGAWRLAFARRGFGASAAKTVQAVNYFCDFEEKLEALVRARL